MTTASVTQQIVGCSGEFSVKTLSELWLLSVMVVGFQQGIGRKSLQYCASCGHWVFIVVAGKTLTRLALISITFA